MHRKSHRDDSPPSGRRPSLSRMSEWEQMWVRRLGLEDVDWDPELYCPHCIVKRAAREEVMEELAPPSGRRPRLLLSFGLARLPPRAGGRKRRSKRRGKRVLLKLVRLARIEREDF